VKLLEHVTFVDTPGVLSGEKQRTQRSYDFTGVTSWFAAKCDLILLLFDPHKLDISDEFKRVIGSLRGHDDKIRIVLNKADQVDAQQVNILCLCPCPFPIPQHVSMFNFLAPMRTLEIYDNINVSYVPNFVSRQFRPSKLLRVF
jgi:hypothetical protein